MKKIDDALSVALGEAPPVPDPEPAIRADGTEPRLGRRPTAS